ncbi:hypothetical protein D3C80_1611390 [compost metagenome]
MQQRYKAVVDIGIARVLLERPDLVQLVGNLIAEGVLLTVIGCVAGLTNEAVAVDSAVGVGQYRAPHR